MLKFQVRKRQNDAAMSASPTPATTRSFYDNCALDGGDERDFDYIDRMTSEGSVGATTTTTTTAITTTTTTITTTADVPDSGIGSFAQSLTSAESALSLWSDASSSSLSAVATSDATIRFNSSDYPGQRHQPTRHHVASKCHRTVISLIDNSASKSTNDSTAPFPLGYGTIVRVAKSDVDNTENVAPPLPDKSAACDCVKPLPPPVPPRTSLIALREIDMLQSLSPVPNKPPRQMRQIFTEKLLNFEAQKPQRLTFVASSPPSPAKSPTIPNVLLTAATPPSTSNHNGEGVVANRPFTHSSSQSSARADGGKNSLALPVRYGSSGDRLTALSRLSAYHRSNSLGSLSSLDSGESSLEWSYLRVFTGSVRAETDYVTLKIAAQTTAREVVARLLAKFRLASRDANLFQLWMEVRTRSYDGTDATSVLELDRHTRPLELQRCHPPERLRFVLVMATNAVLVRIFDGDVCPQSNYKSVLISRRTSCIEVLHIVLRMCRVLPSSRDDVVEQTIAPVTSRSRRNSTTSAASTVAPAPEDDDEDQRCLNEYGLFVELNDAVLAEGSSPPVVHSARISSNCALADVYLRLASQQCIALRRLR